MYRVLLKPLLGAASLMAYCLPSQAIEVYMFRGAGDFSFVQNDLHFSRGLTQMADALNAEGIFAEVRGFSRVDNALNTIRSRKPSSIAFVGHSMGALASMAIAKTLKSEGYNIEYMALIDIPGPVGVAGDNVKKVENYFSINPVYGKLTNVSTHPDAKNIHVGGYMHNRMDDSPEVQQGILRAIRTIHRSEGAVQYAQQTPAQQLDMTTTASLPETQPVRVEPEAWRAQLVESNPYPAAKTESLAQPFLLPSVRPHGQMAPTAIRSTVQTKVTNELQSQTGTVLSGVVDRGRSLIGSAGSFLQRLQSRREANADRFGPDGN